MKGCCKPAGEVASTVLRDCSMFASLCRHNWNGQKQCCIYYFILTEVLIHCRSQCSKNLGTTWNHMISASASSRKLPLALGGELP